MLWKKNKSEKGGNRIGMGMIWGVAFGNAAAITVGSIMSNIPIAMCFGSSIGMFISMAVGAILDKKSKNNK